MLRARAGVFETSGDAGTSADTNFDDGDDDGDDDDDGGNPHPGGQLSNDNDEPTIAPAANASGAVETAAKKPRMGSEEADVPQDAQVHGTLRVTKKSKSKKPKRAFFNDL